MLDYRNCILYCFPKAEIHDFQENFAIFFKLNKISSSFFNNSYLEVSIRKNDEFNWNKALNFPDGFINFKVKIEIEFNFECSLEFCCTTVGFFLKWLWDSEIPAVASYDLEDRLPHQGGYMCKYLPWVR